MKDMKGKLALGHHRLRTKTATWRMDLLKDKFRLLSDEAQAGYSDMAKHAKHAKNITGKMEMLNRFLVVYVNTCLDP